MNTENKTGGKGIWLKPLLLALPFLAAAALALFRFGPALMRIVSVLIKGAVVS